MAILKSSSSDLGSYSSGYAYQNSSGNAVSVEMREILVKWMQETWPDLMIFFCPPPPSTQKKGLRFQRKKRKELHSLAQITDY